MPMLRGMPVCSSFSVCSPINLQGAAGQLQAAVRSKDALLGVWGSPVLPITKKGRAKGKIPQIHHIFTLQMFGDKVLVPSEVLKSRDSHRLGARLRGRTATQRSKKGSEKVLERVLGKGSQKGSEKGV